MFPLHAITIFVICACASLLCEFLSWALLFRTPDFKALKSDIAHSEEQKKQAKKLTKQLAQQKLTAQLFWYRMKQVGLVLVIMTATFQFVTFYYKGLVVAKLPFTPPRLMAKFTHRGLTSNDLTDCSAHTIFALSSMATKMFWTKFFNVEAQRIMGPPVFEVPKLE